MFIGVITYIVLTFTFITIYTNDCYPMTKEQLRKLYEKERENIMTKHIQENVKNIWSNVITLSKLGITEYIFHRFLCKPDTYTIQHTICKQSMDIPKRNEAIKLFHKYNIKSEEINEKIIYELRRLFPDSIIKEDFQRCCHSYKIIW